LYTRFWIAEVAQLPGGVFKTKQKKIPVAKVHGYAVPILIENFISDFPGFKI